MPLNMHNAQPLTVGRPTIAQDICLPALLAEQTKVRHR